MIKKNFLIAEIGLNHLGNIKKLNIILKKLNKSNIDAVTIQIFKKEFFKKNKLESYYIKKKILVDYFFKRCKKKIGIVTDDLDKTILKYFNKIIFFKVLGYQFKNKKLINRLIGTKKKIYFSNRGLDNKENNNLAKLIKTNQNFNLIHTQQKINKKFANLINLKFLKKTIGSTKKVSFGLHCDDKRILYESVLYKPNSIFFYIKGANSNIKYLDDKYAISLEEIDFVIENLRFLNYNLRNYKVI